MHHQGTPKRGTGTADLSQSHHQRSPPRSKLETNAHWVPLRDGEAGSSAISSTRGHKRFEQTTHLKICGRVLLQFLGISELSYVTGLHPGSSSSVSSTLSWMSDV